MEEDEPSIESLLEKISSLTLFNNSKNGLLKQDDNNMIDLNKLKDMYTSFENVTDHLMSSSLLDKIHKDIISEENHFKTEYRYYVVIMMNPLLLRSIHIKEKIMDILCKEFIQNQDKIELIIDKTLSASTVPEKYRQQIMHHLIAALHQFIAMKIINKDDAASIYLEVPLIEAVQCLSMLYNLNQNLSLVPYYDFYNDSIESSLDIKEDYPRWKIKDGFSFCSYPFLLKTHVKSEILRVECLISMRHELQDSFFRAMFIGVNSPYLQLEIRRTHVIRDALYQLQIKNQHDLKKQMKISFAGEEGIDEGGVQKEFFQLAVKELFHIDYGMFRYNDDSTLCWFAIDENLDQATLEEYHLIGQLIGLAIYNGVVLDLHLPLAFYKKLFGYPLQLDDLEEYDPIFHKSLIQLSKFDGDVQETFQRQFQIQVRTQTGQIINVDLIPDGSQKDINNENRHLFIQNYLTYFFDKSCERQFDAVQKGFYRVMDSHFIKLFRPEELQELLCGSPSLDFDELEEATHYDGFTKESTIVQHFWEIVKSFDDEWKKKLLLFTTGTDRVPVGGLSKLHFVIAKNGVDSDRLPTSHTCYNVLLLSDYASKDKLKDRLMVALSNCDCGFFLN